MTGLFLTPTTRNWSALVTVAAGQSRKTTTSKKQSFLIWRRLVTLLRKPQGERVFSPGLNIIKFWGLSVLSGRRIGCSAVDVDFSRIPSLCGRTGKTFINAYRFEPQPPWLVWHAVENKNFFPSWAEPTETGLLFTGPGRIGFTTSASKPTRSRPGIGISITVNRRTTVASACCDRVFGTVLYPERRLIFVIHSKIDVFPLRGIDYRRFNNDYMGGLYFQMLNIFLFESVPLRVKIKCTMLRVKKTRTCPKVLKLQNYFFFRISFFFQFQSISHCNHSVKFHTLYSIRLLN